MTRNLTEIISLPNEEFRFTLESINSAFGISAATLKAIAQSHGVKEERIIIRALTQWAKEEVLGLDLDEPLLSSEQLEVLRQRRVRIDEDRKNRENRPSLFEQFKEQLRVDGEPDDAQLEKPGPHNEGPD
jgi:hypothetical protein